MTAIEDLMREHGVLNRVLLIYDKIVANYRSGLPVPDGILKSSALIVRHFIEDYHEKSEENYIFPLLLNAKRHVKLVKELKIQHRLGRKLTDCLIKLGALKNPSESQIINIVETIEAFNEMYRAHESREDTVVFQELHKLLTVAEYHQVGQELESAEEAIPGYVGFHKTLSQVEQIEKKLGIDNIALETEKLRDFLSQPLKKNCFQ